jgi:hypothetical protein
VSEKNKRILGIHLALAFVEIICVSGFVFEYLRARSGDSLSWAYVFEWPIFGGYALYMWRKLLREERGEAPPRKDSPVTRSDETLSAYNEYLRKVHDGTPEGHSDTPKPPR